ncbi:hypothetical protein [Sphingomonas paeninsulae]|nr:hypothetical protein [Sphingomonas paeninsulae]
MIQALGDVIGGAIIAIAMAWFSWNLFKIIHYPELGPVAGFFIVTASLVTTHHGSRMLPIIFIFSLISMFCGWSEAAAWRARRDERKGQRKGSNLAGVQRFW